MATKTSIYGEMVSAPDSLTLEISSMSATNLTTWLKNVVQYAQAMHSLDRAVVLTIDNEEIAFGSIPESLP